MLRAGPGGITLSRGVTHAPGQRSLLDIQREEAERAAAAAAAAQAAAAAAAAAGEYASAAAPGGWAKVAGAGIGAGALPFWSWWNRCGQREC